PPTPTDPLSLHDALPISRHRFGGCPDRLADPAHQPFDRAPPEEPERSQLETWFAQNGGPTPASAGLSPRHGRGPLSGDHQETQADRKSTRLNSSHVSISY